MSIRGFPWNVPGAFLAFYTAHELPGLFLFILVEEAGVPLLLPGDTLIIAAARKGGGWASALLVILTAAAAATAGSSLLYAMLRRGGRPALHRFERLLHLNERRIARMEQWFQRHGALAIIAGRLIPGLRMPTSAMAGLFAVPYRVFAPATAVAAVLWSAMYFLIGLLLQREGQVVLDALADVDESTAVIVGLVLLAVAIGAISWRRVRRRSRMNPHEIL